MHIHVYAAGTYILYGPGRAINYGTLCQARLYYIKLFQITLNYAKLRQILNSSARMHYNKS